LLDKLFDTCLGLVVREVKEARVQHKVLAHRELAIKRERLRHVPNAATDLDAARVN